MNPVYFLNRKQYNDRVKVFGKSTYMFALRTVGKRWRLIPNGPCFLIAVKGCRHYDRIKFPAINAFADVYGKNPVSVVY